MTIKFKNIITYMLAAGIISCGGQSSDPLGKYSQLKTSLPSEKVSETQTLAPDVFTSANLLDSSEILSLQLQGTNEINNANFLENQLGILYFKITPKSEKITKYNVELTEFLMGEQPLSEKPVIFATDKPNIFGLKWLAPSGLIPPGRLFVSLIAKIQTTVLEAADQNLQGLSKLDQLLFIVSRDNSVPKILGRSNLDSGIDEDAKGISFTVDIEDPASLTSPRVPDIQITSYRYSNIEAFRADGSKFISIDSSKSVNPERLSEKSERSGKWRFYYIIKADQLPLNLDRKGLENPLAPSVEICFHLRAISVIATQSEQQQVCLVARYAAQLPQLTWEIENLKDLQAAVTHVLKFKISSPNNLGQVSIKDPAAQISKLSGTKELKCQPESGGNLATQVCELSWTPACIKNETPKKLTLKVENKTGAKVKSQTFSKDFLLLPNESACSSKVQSKSSSKSSDKVKSQTKTEVAK